METILLIIVIIVVVGVALAFKKPLENSTKKQLKYTYYKKSRVMTETEYKFWQILKKSNAPVIIHQAHLSTFLNHKVKGQNWKGAFSHINSKSVDYLICSETMEPLLAIELDDYTHKRADRAKRDEIVNAVIYASGTKLARYDVSSLSDELTIVNSINQNLA